jgi:hypothetical protein
MTSQIAIEAKTEDKLTLKNYLLFMSTQTATELPDGGWMKVSVRLRA